ncbi:hypothetical protein ES288_A08G091000v1 [Gossypium darwinii]|uniref:Uncharacterized protein n=1 Tax=Gossypium darwinii TaxID=34276 RepID=A0A5D2FIJ7_GOSDA|nr:hypothetical protein ES288_A08G091000v1 [Gossypium darwinii]
MEEALGFLLSPTSTMGRDPPTSRPQEALTEYKIYCLRTAFCCSPLFVMFAGSWSVNGRENLPFWCKEATIGRRTCRGHTWEGGTTQG